MLTNWLFSYISNPINREQFLVIETKIGKRAKCCTRGRLEGSSHEVSTGTMNTLEEHVCLLYGEKNTNEHP